MTITSKALASTPTAHLARWRGGPTRERVEWIRAAVSLRRGRPVAREEDWEDLRVPVLDYEGRTISSSMRMLLHERDKSGSPHVFVG